MGTKSLCLQYILSNFVFTMLLIFQITKTRIYGFMCCVLTEIENILIFKHEFTVYHPSSSIFSYLSTNNNFFHNIFSNYTWKALNHTFGSMKFIQRTFFTFQLLQGWLFLSFSLFPYAWCNICMLYSSIQCSSCI